MFCLAEYVSNKPNIQQLNILIFSRPNSLIFTLTEYSIVCPNMVIGWVVVDLIFQNKIQMKKLCICILIMCHICVHFYYTSDKIYIRDEIVGFFLVNILEFENVSINSLLKRKRKLEKLKYSNF